MRPPKLRPSRSDWNAVVASHHVPNIGNAITFLTMGPIGTNLGWSRPFNTSAVNTQVAPQLVHW